MSPMKKYREKMFRKYLILPELYDNIIAERGEKKNGQ